MKKSRSGKVFANIRKKNALILLVLSIGLVYLLFDQKGLIQRLSLAGKKASLENRIEELRKENASMRAEITKLQTSDAEIERIAREKYFMHKNGEKIIKVEPR
ncbi:MAG: septum formation initiator family protein [Bacteroidetes bacterium]|nr:septum formation initiator family protein [Bacteroidota bacterium]